MEPNAQEDLDLSVAMNRIEDTDSVSPVTKKAVNVKAILAIAGIAVAGGGLTLMSHSKAKKEAAQAPGDTLAMMQAARAQATGYDPSKDQPFNPAAAQVVGVPPDTSAEAKMKALQEQARVNGGAPGAGGATQQSAPGGGQQAGHQGAMANRAGGSGGAGVPGPPASILPADLRIRLQPEYQQWLEHQSTPAVAWSRSDAGMTSTSAVAGPSGQQQAGLPGVDPSLQNLYAGGQNSGSRSQNFYMPASAELTCVTDHPINTDYPGAIRATVVAPAELKGAKMIVNHSGVNLERANATVGTLVVNRGGAWSQYAVQGQIRTDLPALNGIVNHHYARRLMPAVANAGIAGGALYLSGNSKSNAISTQDQIYNSMMVAGLNGIQTEIGKINEGKPEVTIVVPAGQEFNVLLTAGLEIK